MPKKSGLTNRNFGLNHEAGKGSKPRTKFDENWRERYSEIDWKNISRKKTKTLRELEEEHEWRMGL